MYDIISKLKAKADIIFVHMYYDIIMARCVLEILSVLVVRTYSMHAKTTTLICSAKKKHK